VSSKISDLLLFVSHLKNNGLSLRPYFISFSNLNPNPNLTKLPKP